MVFYYWHSVIILFLIFNPIHQNSDLKTVTPSIILPFAWMDWEKPCKTRYLVPRLRKQRSANQLTSQQFICCILKLNYIMPVDLTETKTNPCTDTISWSSRHVKRTDITFIYVSNEVDSNSECTNIPLTEWQFNLPYLANTASWCLVVTADCDITNTVKPFFIFYVFFYF